jgi:hypothetical protein
MGVNMTDDELKELVASLAIDSKNLHEAQKSTDEQMKRTDEKLERIGIKLDKLGELYGNLGQNQGDVAEDFFFQSLIKDNHLGSIHFDDVVKNMEKHRGQLQEEYDLVMTNGETVGIVEVKYKAHENDLDKLDRKMRNFKELFPWFKNYKQYGAIAFFINDKAKKEALRRGYFVLQRSGDLIHTESSDHLTVL